MKTHIYIDGFNLYYGALKDGPYRWLDVSTLCQLLLPQNNITKIKYFTALVKGRPYNPNQAARQRVYLRALKTISHLEIHYGYFLSHVVRMPQAGSAQGSRPTSVKVIKTEEKGSDVNIATHLLTDAMDGAFDVAVLITNDSDLTLPVSIVREKFQLPVGIINPTERRVSRALVKHASFIRTIRKGVLEASQFPDVLQDKQGLFHKPKEW